MNSFFKKRGVAWVVLVLSIIASVTIGQLKSSGASSYNGSGYSKWIVDDGNLISASAEKTVCTYNEKWDKEYHAIVAIVTTKEISADLENKSHDLANSLGLGKNDMLLVLEKKGEWFLDIDESLYSRLSDAQAGKISSAMSNYFYSGNYDKAVEETFKVLDSFYASANRTSSSGIAGVVIFLIVVIVLWVLIDKLRYNRYRRRAMNYGMGGSPAVYYPVFWGRRAIHTPPTHVNDRPGGGYSSSRPNSNYHSSSRPSSGFHSNSHSGPRGGFGGSSHGGSRGSFGGGSRGGFGGGRR